MKKYVKDMKSLQNIRKFMESEKNIELKYNDDWAVYR